MMSLLVCLRSAFYASSDSCALATQPALLIFPSTWTCILAGSNSLTCHNMVRAVLALACISHATLGFAPAARPRVGVARHAAREPFDCEVDLETGEPVTVQITPTMSDSELVVAKYPLPFFIDIENRAQLGAVVTKDGSEQQNKGVERVGDRLRAFTYYEYGAKASDGGGVLTMLNSFSGSGYSWNRQLFDATFVSWESSLEKLVTNEPRRTNSVTMVFERPVAPAPAPAAPPAAE